VFKASHKQEQEFKIGHKIDFKIKFDTVAPKGISCVKAGDEVEEEKPEEKEPTL